MAKKAAHSSETDRTYRLDRLIGKGGFGEVYLATPLPRSGLPPQVCVKISERLAGWVREAYFAELLDREPRALKVYDRFAEVEGSRTRYCLAMEYAEHGDLGAWLARKGPQPERFVRRELAAILGALDTLHRGGALHRDLTPFNVFVCEHDQLKLGDFGIARHQRNPRGVTADAFNPMNAPTEIAWGWVRKWQQRDDIYQVGQLAAMLLRGDIARPMRSRDVRGLPCSDHLKEVIHRCLGVRGKRYPAAGELVAALRHRPKALPVGRVGSLAGKRLSFTGFLKRLRSEAISAARKAGAVVQSKPVGPPMCSCGGGPTGADRRRRGRHEADRDPAPRRERTPHHRHRRADRQDGSLTVLRNDDSLDGEDVLPGFTCALAAVLSEFT